MKCKLTTQMVLWLASLPWVLKVVGSIPGRLKPNTLKFVFAVSLLSTKHLAVRAKTGWLRIRIMCLGKGVMSSCGLLHCKNLIQLVSLAQGRAYSSLYINMLLSSICMKYLLLDFKQHSINQYEMLSSKQRHWYQHDRLWA